MKRQILLCILSLLFTQAWAQDQEGNDYFFGDNFHFHGSHIDLRMMHYGSLTFQISDKRIWSIFEKFENSNSLAKDEGQQKPKNKILLGIKLAPTLKNYFSAKVPNFTQYYYSYLIPDSSEATIVAMGINRNNISNYRYRMVLNDSLEILKWAPIAGLEMKYGAKIPYGKIGTFKFPGQKLLVEVAHKDSIWLRDGYIMDWTKNEKPEINQITARGTSAYGYYGLNLDSLRKINQGQGSLGRTKNIEWTFEKDSVREFDLGFTQHETRPYSIYLIKDVKNKRDTIRLAWWEIDNQFTVENDYVKEVGQYSLFIQQTGMFGEFPMSEMTQIDFRVIEAAVHGQVKRYTFNQVFIFAVSLLVCLGLGFLSYRWQIKRKIKKADQAKELIKIQMQGVQSQLNPHFMFNSINSILNLIQKGQIDSAKNYLYTFSSLTREVLEDSEKEMHSLTAELKLIKEYLMMEQLRFGFSYQIKQQIDICTDNVDVPVMLLQPFVENAVKHGVSNLLEQGVIEIIVSNKADDLILEVFDNGGRWETSLVNSETGYGIHLSKKRIQLLNQLYPQNRVEMKFLASQPGKKVSVILRSWLN